MADVVVADMVCGRYGTDPVIQGCNAATNAYAIASGITASLMMMMISRTQITKFKKLIINYVTNQLIITFLNICNVNSRSFKKFRH